MRGEVREAPVVVYRCSESPAEDGALCELIEEALRRKWLADSGGRVVVAIAHGRERDEPKLFDGVVQELERQLPSSSLEVWDLTEGRPIPPTLLDHPVYVRSSRVPGGVRVGWEMFRRLQLVVVGRFAKAPGARFAGALRVAASLLAPVNRWASPPILAAEAERLAAPDVALVYASERDGKAAGGGHLWLMSPDALAVDCALASACGATPAGIPHLREIARRRPLPRPVVVGDELPNLCGSIGPRWSAVLAENLWRAQMQVVAAVAGMQAVREKAKKVPGAVRRRLAARFRKSTA